MLPLRRAWRHSCLLRYPKRELSLAYNLHEPNTYEAGHAPLIVLHGLFGSKQNNRSISKYGFLRLAFQMRHLIEQGTCTRSQDASVCTCQSLIWHRRKHISLIILQDLRNHGDSPHDPVHDYSAMAVDVEEFIQQHDLHLPTLIGHSMSVSISCTRS